MTETNSTFTGVAGPCDAMTVIAKTDRCARQWQQVLAGVSGFIRARQAHPARTVVLVPYAQLMPWAQRYWALHHADGFAPRFETTRNWARQLAAFVPQGHDFAGDVARDTLTARALLDRAGLTAQRDMLAGPLQEAAAQLAMAVSAVAPPGRAGVVICATKPEKTCVCYLTLCKQSCKWCHTTPAAEPLGSAVEFSPSLFLWMWRDGAPLSVMNLNHLPVARKLWALVLGLMISMADFARRLPSSFSSSSSLRRASGVSGPASSRRICILISFT